MFQRSPPALGLFSRFTGSTVNMRSVVEGHFWSLTRYRIGPRFLGLDSAGNILFYPNYRKESFGGWRAITLGSPNENFLSSDTGGTNVLEDGHPMHYKACRKLQVVIDKEKKKWTAAQEAKRQKKLKEDAERAVREAAGGEAAKAKEESAAKAQRPNIREVLEEHLYEEEEQRFRDVLAIKLSHPQFYTKHMRISSLMTFLYKCFYYYLWAVLVSLFVQAYLMFRSWLHAPAREGLKNIEEHVLHVPRLLFALVVYGIASLARASKPVLDPVFNAIAEYFPGIKQYNPDWVATRATTLADHTHPKVKERDAQLKVQQGKIEQQRRQWWTRALLLLLALFGILSII